MALFVSVLHATYSQIIVAGKFACSWFGQGCYWNIYLCESPCLCAGRKERNVPARIICGCISVYQQHRVNVSPWKLLMSFARMSSIDRKAKQFAIIY